MRIVMFTNTYLPHVGGVARSVERFAGEFRRRGHRVLVVAPSFPGGAREETDVLRFPALQQFNGSDFSIPVPVPGRLAAALADFRPQLVHSHHPFLLGDTALRVGASRGLPVVFTHHTRYEDYTHYVPGDSPRLKKFVVDLVTGYCNLCAAVIAPSASVAALLRERGVSVPVEVIPTGVAVEEFSGGDGAAFRARLGIPSETFVAGHLGRLAPEKNLVFLAEALVRFLQGRQGARFLLAGKGPAGEAVEAILRTHGLSERLHRVGILAGGELAAAYAAMDVFAFASRSETQGMVLAEAMAAGVPVVALDAPGVREVIRDGANGRLLPAEDLDAFAAALEWTAALSSVGRERLGAGARATAESLSLGAMAGRTLALYESLLQIRPAPPAVETSLWAKARRGTEEEWKILRSFAHAVRETILTPRNGGS